MSPEAAAALEQLRVLGFKVTSHLGYYQLTRFGSTEKDGMLANISNDPAVFDRCVLEGLKVARAILKDESDRLKLPRPVFGKALNFSPYA